MLSLLQSIGLSDLLVFVILIIIGIIVILVLKALISFLLPIVAAAVVWFLTSKNLLYAGVAFVVVALLQLGLKRR